MNQDPYFGCHAPQYGRRNWEMFDIRQAYFNALCRARCYSCDDLLSEQDGSRGMCAWCQHLEQTGQTRVY